MPIAQMSPERIEQINSQLLTAGAVGFLKGTIVALVSGSYFSYKYNFGHNKRFFLPQCKVGYFIAWGIVGITFAVENAKISVTKDLAEEENIQRQLYCKQELGGN
ncbi:hypothetical protein METBIDRAFT_12889 [Metschnikowia bicuspidata var. bicuspidata NRRL YB-4993]|uniref:HIG1 domain-containing protein n=1 Tax=Metschnikowia bicuspidata var. bicuspidata NRRL YB-4993 TaxID=869754 RepID=A0A1A0H7I1_9ASCO|nr:hypothetical protein METBIDRAFT_12889 [Metschnikowia bicuspidata var. bicuspidata NRRL YB-4993]OBA19852.1 hypothetical protein METBIDRAFT_12889 [Metschnikowia bicuspidata var. bicuspidata NRRL YB-4993]